MKLTAQSIARLIDISAVQAPHGKTEIRQMVRAAREHRFIAVHVLPCWVRFLREELPGPRASSLARPWDFLAAVTAPR